MRFFQSDNVWKRRELRQERSRLPEAERQLLETEDKLKAECVWLFGAIILSAAGIIGLLLGIIPVNAVNLVFTMTLLLYVLITARPFIKLLNDYRDKKKAKD